MWGTGQASRLAFTNKFDVTPVATHPAREPNLTRWHRGQVDDSHTHR